LCGKPPFTQVLALSERQPERPRRRQQKGITCRAVSPAVSDGECFSETGAASRGILRKTCPSRLRLRRRASATVARGQGRQGLVNVPSAEVCHLRSPPPIPRPSPQGTPEGPTLSHPARHVQAALSRATPCCGPLGCGALGAPHALWARRGCRRGVLGECRRGGGAKRPCEFPSMLPLLSSPFLHIFSPAFSERGITSSRAVWRLWLTPRSRLTQVLAPVPVQTRSIPIDLFPRLR